jgi:hypothetical protein
MVTKGLTGFRVHVRDKIDNILEENPVTILFYINALSRLSAQNFFSDAGGFDAEEAFQETLEEFDQVYGAEGLECDSSEDEAEFWDKLSPSQVLQVIATLSTGLVEVVQ